MRLQKILWIGVLIFLEWSTGSVVYSSDASSDTITVLQDSFNSNSIDDDKWVLANPDHNFSTIENNALHLRSSNKNSGWIYSQERFSLRNKIIQIQVLQANDDGALGISPTAQTSNSSGFYEEANWYRFYNYRSNEDEPYKLYVQWRKNRNVGGLDVAQDENFNNPFALRIRTEDGKIYFEYSFDQQIWIIAYSETFALPGYSLDDSYHIELSGNDTPTDGEWILDNFSIHSYSFSVDTRPPVISQIEVSPSNTNTTITWKTDEPATSQILYGSNNSYGSTTPLDSELKTLHEITLNSLTAATTYHYQVVSVDDVGNIQNSNDRQFMTSGDLVDEMSDDFSSSSLDLTKWQVGKNAGNVSDIEDGALRLRSTRKSSGWIYTKNQFSLSDKTIQVKVIQPNKDGALGISPTVTENASTGFYREKNWYRFYNYRDSQSGPYKLFVQWSKDGNVDGFDVAEGEAFISDFFLRIRYDADVIYFEYSFDNTTWITAYDEVFSLPGYGTDDFYHFELCAYNTSQNGEWLVDDFSITTEDVSVPGDTTPPVISQIIVDNINTTSAEIHWQTDEPATTEIEYGTNTNYGSPLSSDNLFTNHHFSLSGLVHNTRYHFRIKNTDVVGNEAVSNDFTFTTEEISTPVDTTGPVISQVVVDDINNTSAMIHWQTDESAIAEIEYGIDTNYDSTLSSNDFITNHSFLLSGLAQNTQYHFQVKSRDSFNNETISNNFTFTTLASTSSFFTDDFNDNELDEDKWNLGSNGGNISQVTGDALELASERGETGWVISQDSFVARNTTVAVKIVQPNEDGNMGITPTYTPSSMNGIYSEATWYRYYVYRSGSKGNYRLYVQWRKNGTVDGLDVTGSLALSGVFHMRLRMDESQINFEISLDGDKWLTTYSEVFSLTGYSLDDAYHYELAAYHTDRRGDLIIDIFSISEGADPSDVPAVQNRIMLVGNSITEGVGSTDGFGFRQQLHEKFSDANIDFAFVGSEGEESYKGFFSAGQKIDAFYPSDFDHGDGTGIFDIANAMLIYQPNIVMLHLGTNDLTRETFIGPYSDDDGETLNGSTSGQLAQLLKYLLQWHDGTHGDFLQQIYASQIIPREDRTQEVDEFNSEIDAIVNDFTNGDATGNTEPVYLVDHFTPFISNGDLFSGNSNDIMSDALHPNDAGYNIMANTYFETFIQIFGISQSLLAAKTSSAEEQLTPPGPIPHKFALSQNYPNPFASGNFHSDIGTTIRYQLPTTSIVKLEIYDILGRRVRGLVDEQISSGFHRVRWDGQNEAGIQVSSGAYFYVLRAKGFFKSMKMTVVR